MSLWALQLLETNIHKKRIIVLLIFKRDFNTATTGEKISVDGVIGPATLNALMTEPILGPKYAQIAAKIRAGEAVDTLQGAMRKLVNPNAMAVLSPDLLQPEKVMKQSQLQALLVLDIKQTPEKRVR